MPLILWEVSDINYAMNGNQTPPKYFLFSLTTQVARRLVHFYNQVLEPLGLTSQQLLALAVLWQEEGLSLGEFARRAGVGKAAAVAMIDRLETQGWVTRNRHPRDGRLNVLRLSPRAHQMAPQILDRVGELEQHLEAKLGPEAMIRLRETLLAIRDLDI